MSDVTSEMVETAHAAAVEQGLPKNATVEVDPWALEEAHTNAAKEAAAAKPYDPMDNDAVNQAAQVFGNSVPRIKALARNLKGGQLYRVFKNVIEFPLQEGEPKFNSKVENELFIMCLSAIQAKTVMINAMSAQRAMEDKAAREADAAAMGELKTLSPEEMVKAEVDNGSSN